jgi:hypothetical protein
VPLIGCGEADKGEVWNGKAAPRISQDRAGAAVRASTRLTVPAAKDRVAGHVFRPVTRSPRFFDARRRRDENRLEKISGREPRVGSRPDRR